MQSQVSAAVFLQGREPLSVMRLIVKSISRRVLTCVWRLLQMLRQGFAVDSSDYDGRTALMLAAAKGHADVVNSLLAAGCDPQVGLRCHQCLLFLIWETAQHRMRCLSHLTPITQQHGMWEGKVSADLFLQTCG